MARTPFPESTVLLVKHSPNIAIQFLLKCKKKGLSCEMTEFTVIAGFIKKSQVDVILSVDFQVPQPSAGLKGPVDQGTAA